MSRLDEDPQAAIEREKYRAAEAKRKTNLNGASAPDLPPDAALPDQIPAQNGEEFTMQKIDWHWRSWLACGKFHILAGSKGAGKSTIGYDLMATTSVGGKWPDGTPAPIGDVLVWSGEDGIEDTILPRFVAAGGALKRIYPIRTIISNGAPRPFDPSTDIAALVDLAATLPELKMVMIDPVVLALPIKSDSHKNTETRRGLQPLVDLAEQRNVVLLGITHFTKGTADQDPVERVTGSLAFGALARIVLGASADEDERQRRLVRIASNIGPSGGGIEYTMIQAPLIGYDDLAAQRISWGTQIRGSARELLNASKQSAQADATAFLTDLLKDGAQPQAEVKAAAEAHCHSWATVRRAQKNLGIKPVQVERKWMWSMPTCSPGGWSGRPGV